MKTYKVELTEDFIKEAHEVACDEWKTKIEDLVPEAFETKAKENTWYSIDDALFLTTEINNIGVHYGYRIENNQWIDSIKGNKVSHCACNEVAFKDRARYATRHEVITALKVEAIKRGLIEGVEVKCLYDGQHEKLESGGYCLTETGSQLFWNNNVCIFDSGKWAEPIEDNTEKRKRNYILQKIEEMENQLNELKKEL